MQLIRLIPTILLALPTLSMPIPEAEPLALPIPAPFPGPDAAPAPNADPNAFADPQPEPEAWPEAEPEAWAEPEPIALALPQIDAAQCNLWVQAYNTVAQSEEADESFKQEVEKRRNEACG